MRDIFSHFIVAHFKLEDPAIFRLAPLTVYIVALETSRLVAYTIGLWNEFITRRRDH